MTTEEIIYEIYQDTRNRPFEITYSSYLPEIIVWFYASRIQICIPDHLELPLELELAIKLR